MSRSARNRTIRRRAGLASIALVVAACSGSGSDTPAAPAPAPSAPSAPAAPTGGELAIGVITALTGPNAVFGEDIAAGATFAAEQINAEGGINGWTIRIVAEDHAVEPDRAVTAAQKLLNVDGVSAVLSSFTAPTLAVQPLFAERDTLMLNGGAIGAALIGQDALYNTLANSVFLYARLMEWAMDEYSPQSVATLYWNDSAGNAIDEVVKEQCKLLGCTVVASEPHDIGATDFGTQLARIAARSPDILVVGSYGDDLGYIVRQARGQGLTVPILSNDFQANAVEIAGAAMEGTIAVLDRFELTSPDPESQAFVAAYQARFNKDPGRFAANYYEHVRFILADLIRVISDRGDDPSAPGALLAELRAGIESSRAYTSLYGESIILNPNGTVDKPVGLFETRNGALVLIKQF